MIVYLDLVIIYNFLINYIFIKLIYILFHEKVATIRVIASSLFSVLLLFSYLFDYYIFMIVKIMGGVLVVLVAIKCVSIIKTIIQISLYYLLQFSLIGIVNSFSLAGIYLLVGLIVIISLFIIEGSIKNYKNTYKVILKLKNTEYKLNALYDTGNLCMYFDKPVVFINKIYEKEIPDKIYKIKVSSISSKEEIKCFIPEEFIVLENGKKVRKEVMISFVSLKKDIDCILNAHLF